MAETRTPIISFKDFSFQYRAQKQPTLHDIDLDIYPGDQHTLTGVDIQVDIMQRRLFLRTILEGEVFE